MNETMTADLNAANEPFQTFGRLLPSFRNQEWGYEEEGFAAPYEIKFPDDRLDCSGYIGKEDKIILLAYLDGACIGQIRIVKDWNKLAYVENIAVRQAYRRSGLGGRLFAAAESWAKERNLPGITLEAQDDNLSACRFYIKQGMQLGGIDTLKYRNNPNIDKALFWYKFF